MSQTSFRAGSGDYQAVRPLVLTVTAIPGLSTSVETFTSSNITTGAIGDLTTDSLCRAEFASPTTYPGLTIVESAITATGTLQITFVNVTGSTISPSSPQVNLLVF